MDHNPEASAYFSKELNLVGVEYVFYKIDGNNNDGRDDMFRLHTDLLKALGQKYGTPDIDESGNLNVESFLKDAKFETAWIDDLGDTAVRLTIARKIKSFMRLDYSIVVLEYSKAGYRKALNADFAVKGEVLEKL